MLNIKCQESMTLDINGIVRVASSEPRRKQNKAKEFPGTSRRKKVQDNLNSVSHGFHLSLRMLHFFRKNVTNFVANVTFLW